MADQPPSPPPAATHDPIYNVTVRVTVRKISDAKRMGNDFVGTFDAHDHVRAEKLGEVAIEAAKMIASGVGPAVLAARAKMAVRDFARRPDVSRIAAITAAGLRKVALGVETTLAETASKLVVQAPPDQD